MAATLQEVMRSRTNDYSEQERHFLARTGLSLVSMNPLLLPPPESIDTSVSVIISCYEGHKTLPLMLRQLGGQSFKNFEVVIVDDGSPNTMLPLVEAETPTFPVKYVREVENRGRSFTRNTGMLIADGADLIFTDQDIVFDSQFVERLALKRASTTDTVLLGFKEDVDLDAVDTDTRADFRTDWRYSIDAADDFLMLGTPTAEEAVEVRTYNILAETDNLKSLGFGRTIGYWDLASMVISHGVCMSKDAAVASGGFPEKGFDGWGAQDIAFGARLIGQGNYIVPSLDTAYFHINHPRYSGSRQQEMEELKQNMVGYRNLLHSQDFTEAPESRSIKKVSTTNNIEYYEV